MASYNKVAGAIDFLVEGINNGTDQWAFALSNSAPAGTTFTAGSTDLATGGGYTQGGGTTSVLRHLLNLLGLPIHPERGRFRTVFQDWQEVTKSLGKTPFFLMYQ